MKDEKFDIKEEYSKLKHILPKFEDLDDEFEISNASIKNKNFLLRNIRRRVNEKVIFYCRIIEGLIYPNSNNIVGMLEIKFFDEEEKNNLSKIYKKLMQFERESLSIDVNPDDKKDVEYINTVFKQWRQYKEELIKITKKMKDSWKMQEEITKDSYFG